METMKRNALSFSLMILLLMMVNLTFAQSQKSKETTVQVSKAHYLGKITNLGEKTPFLTSSEKRDFFKSNKPREVKNFEGYVPRVDFAENAQPKNGDPLAAIPDPQKSSIIPVEAILNFDGINQNEASGVLPPDTNGDVGPNHYFQTTNGGGGSSIKIYDKEGTLLFGPSSSASFWTDVNQNGAGDPIVLYDQYAEAWMFSEFTLNNNMLIAYSETSDPLGDWNVYVVGAPNFPDYPKFGVWPEHLIISSNEGAEPNIPIYVVDKMAMVNGAGNADFVRLTEMPKFGGGGFQVAGAIDADGLSLPATGTKPMVIRLYDDSWEGGQDQLELWEIDVDFTNPGASSMSNIATLNTTPFESELCDGSIFDCIEQSNGTKISALQQVMMHRTQYRNFGAYESIVCNHSVDVTGGDLAGVRWYELRKTPGVANDEWVIYQEGTLGDGVDSRFMASCAMDGAGNMGIGYSITGPGKNLSLRFSGRVRGDVLGTLSVDENEFIGGQSVNPAQRWGDYASMNVDPVNDRTFWFTSEYMGTGGSWRTRIVTFEFTRDTIDVAPFVIKTPESSALLTNAETVQVEFKNFGLSQQGNFDIGYSVNGGAPVVENINVVLPPDSTHTYTFTPTVDMSTIGDYQFKIWTALPGDQNILNDTLTRVISKLTRFDAGIVQVNGLDFPLCNSDAEIQIVINNFGQEVLTSANINITLNGGTVITVPWTGSLAFGETTTIPFLLQNLVDGNNTLEINTSDPNGLADENMDNDSFARSFEAILGGETILLNLLTDNFPNETTWEVADESGNVLFTGGPYTSQATIFVEPWCLEEGCYDFTIFDSYGDGICCGFGIGNYEIVDENGIILAGGGEFGTQETKNFCFPFVCSTTATAETSAESEEGANDASIMVTAQNATPPVVYTLDGGNPQSNPVFNNVSGGVHTITAEDANGCLVNFEVTVATCAMQVTVDVMPPTSATSQDGSLTINVVGANEPVEYSFNGGASFSDNNVLENIGVGNFTPVVRDAAGCLWFEGIEVSETTDTEDLLFGTSVEIFPNPTDGVISVEIKGLGDTYYLPYEVYDVTGKRVYWGSLNSFNGVIEGMISIIAYPEGTYLLKFIHPDLTNLHKVVKVK